MESKEAEILTEMVNDIRNDLIASMQANRRIASGDTIKALQIVQADDQVQLTAPFWIDALEIGRMPTPPGTPPSDPTLFTRIKQWIDDKGLDLNPYAVTRNIHKNGYAGKPGVLTVPLGEDNLSVKAKEAAENLASLIISSSFKPYQKP